MTSVDKEQIDLQRRILLLEPLVAKLKQESEVEKRLHLLNQLVEVQEFLKNHTVFTTFLKELTVEEQLMVKEILAVGQGEYLFCSVQDIENFEKPLRKLLAKLLPAQQFYQLRGGLVGYHLELLKQIHQQTQEEEISDEKVKYLKPEGINLAADLPEVHKAIRWGIELLGRVAEIYPVGGAGDRLALEDEKTGEPLPAAQLPFRGRTLLEGMVRDLQGREFLHHRLMGQEIFTPLALMTSYEKHNDARIRAICTENQWFGRPEESFRLFVQPLVPVLTKEGHWSQKGGMDLYLKPGGHGVIWKLAETEGVFDWLADQGRVKALVRQINNPVAGTDGGLFGLVGIGCHADKAFGFATCSRRLNTAEGMDVLVEKQMGNELTYCVTNVEYTDFQKRGIEDLPDAPGSPFSKFPANTNLLFVDILRVREVIQEHPIPGMLVNMKHQVPYIDLDGKQQEIFGGRLESTMQNIADFIVDSYPDEVPEGERDNFSTFVTYNDRKKTISVTKKQYQTGEAMLETPEGCFFEYLKNSYDLLKNVCGMDVPELVKEEEYLKQGPSFILEYHPALGPLYSVIGQKVRGGSVEKGAELLLEIAELNMEATHVKGSLHVIATDLLGKRDEKGIIRYGNDNGKCTLRNVQIKNRGIVWDGKNLFWKNQIERHETCTIIVHGNGEFYAEDVTLEGNMRIEVPDGVRVVATLEEEEIVFRKEPLEKPSWQWNYTFDTETNRVKLLPRSFC